MGAYELCEQTCVGDFDGDGEIEDGTAADVDQKLVDDVYDSGNNMCATTWTCDCELADVDEDGDVDQADVDWYDTPGNLGSCP